MKKTHLLLILVLLLLAAAVPARANEHEITKTVNAFYDCLERLDSEKMLTFLTPEIAAQVKQDPSKAGYFGEVYEQIREMKKEGVTLKLTERKIAVRSYNDRKAVIQFRARFTLMAPEEDPEIDEYADDITLTRVGDAWLIEKFDEVAQ